MLAIGIQIHEKKDNIYKGPMLLLNCYLHNEKHVTTRDNVIKG